MPIVVTDAGPPHYLVLIDAIDLLSRLFGSVTIPDTVAMELSHPRAPAAVQAWLGSSPSWITVRSVPVRQPPRFPGLDVGEQATLVLAQDLGADLVLVDDRAGAAAARSVGLQVTGTLGILLRAAELGLVDLGEAVSRLRATNFRCRPALLDELVARHRRDTDVP